MKTRRCSTCGLPGHTARTPHRKRNPFRADKAVRYELKESGKRPDVYILDETQGRYRVHSGTIENWRAVAPELRKRGLSLDDVAGGSYIRARARSSYRGYQGGAHLSRPEAHPTRRYQADVLPKLQEKADRIGRDLAGLKSDKEQYQKIVGDLRLELKALGRAKSAAPRRERIRGEIAAHQGLISDLNKDIKRLTGAHSSLKTLIDAVYRNGPKPLTDAQRRSAGRALRRREQMPSARRDRQRASLREHQKGR